MYRASRAIVSLCALAAFAFGQKPEDIVRESSRIVADIQKGISVIPPAILERSECIGVIPGISKAAFAQERERANGVISCATDKGWSAPLFFRAEGGSLASSREQAFVFLVMKEKMRDQITESKFTIGVEAMAMAGPVGRDVSSQTDALLSAHVLSYSFSRGVLAGALLEGALIRVDRQDNWALYGRSTSPKSILDGDIPIPVNFQAPPFPPIPPPPKRRRR
jgi:lipid-binding SYLF domain-containing protein